MSINNLSECFNRTVSFVNSNEYVTMGIVLGLIVFSAYIAPQLSNKTVALFDNPLVKLVIFLVVAYTARKNPTVGIIMAVCLLVILNTVSQRKIEKMIGDVVNDAKREHMDSSIPAIENIRNLDMQNILKLQGQPLGDSQNVANVQINPDSIQNIQQESKQMPQQTQGKCEQKMKYRDEFYPQYTDLEPNAYAARSNLVSGKGYDETCIANDSYPQSSVMGDTYLESNASVGPVAWDSTCGFASV